MESDLEGSVSEFQFPFTRFNLYDVNQRTDLHAILMGSHVSFRSLLALGAVQTAEPAAMDC